MRHRGHMETYWEKLAYSRQELSTCETEPIQFCGAIQNCGWVLVCDVASGQIVAASENCEQLFAQPLSAILGRNAGDFLNFRDGGRFLPKSMVHRDEFVSEGIFVTRSQKLLWESYARFQDLVIIDLELMEAESATESASVLDRLKSLVHLMDQQGDGENGLNIAAKKMKTMTGFDRVMIYRFEPNGDGYVVAEALNDGLEPFKGLRYPSSDIPPKARKIYEISKYRMIVDVQSDPVALCTIPSVARNALDLSGSDLRAVSPFHIQYNRNLGVRASFSTALRVDGRLWGLIICHHYRSARRLSPNLRSACDLAAQIISGRIQDNTAILRSRRKHQILALAQSVILSVTEGKTAAQAFKEHSALFLEVTASSGAFIRLGGEELRIGTLPADAFFDRFLEQLRSRGVSGVWSSDDISLDLGITPDALAAGALVVQLNLDFNDVIIWLRPEDAREVKWGGNPQAKDLFTDALSPRKLFDVWSEKIHGKSREWDASELEAAQTFLFAFVRGLFQKASTLSQANVELARISRAKDDFISLVSHELRTPLGVMIGWMEILREKQIDDFEINQAIEIVDRNAKLQVKLIDDLLDISRIASGKVRINLSDGVSLSRIITDAISDLGPTADLKSVQIYADLPVDVISKFDAELMRQVVWNLVANAIKFTDRGGWVKVRLLHHDAKCEIQVIDSGLGIKKSQLIGIFDRFAQADESHAQKGGLGLGLSIVKGLVELHGGQVIAESEGPGRGSTFVVTLPVVDPALKGGELISDQNQNDPAAPGVFVGLRVLIAEDNPDAGLAMLLTMRKLGAYAELVDNGQKAFDRLGQEKFDLLLSDIAMPEVDGYELMRKRRAHEKATGAAPLQAIALTAYGTSQDAFKCVDAGFQRHVKKPTSRAELVVAIKSLGIRGKTSS